MRGGFDDPQADTEVGRDISLGTTIVGVSYDGGIILGADSRTSGGAYIANRHQDKITPLSDTVYMCRSGSASDTQAIATFVQVSDRTRRLGLLGLPPSGRPCGGPDGCRLGGLPMGARARAPPRMGFDAGAPPPTPTACCAWAPPQFYVAQHQAEKNGLVDVATAAHLISSIAYSNKNNLQAGMIVGGYDKQQVRPAPRAPLPSTLPQGRAVQ